MAAKLYHVKRSDAEVLGTDESMGSLRGMNGLFRRPGAVRAQDGGLAHGLPAPVSRL
jgi:hypothetical protein